jgi:hypothetical protein
VERRGAKRPGERRSPSLQEVIRSGSSPIHAGASRGRQYPVGTQRF